MAGDRPGECEPGCLDGIEGEAVGSQGRCHAEGQTGDSGSEPHRLQRRAEIGGRNRRPASAEILGHGTGKRLGRSDEGHLLAGGGPVERSPVNAVELKRPCRGGAEECQGLEPCGAAGVGVHGRMAAGSQLDAPLRILAISGIDGHRHRAEAVGELLPAVDLGIELIDDRQLRQAGVEVVEHLDIFPDLRHRRKHEGDDQLPGHELAEIELPLDHQPSAQTEESGARQGLDCQGEDDLPPDHREVAPSRREIGVDPLLGPLGRERQAALAAERAGAARQILEPGRKLILRRALGDARANAAGAENEEQECHEEYHDDGKHEQVGMVERQHDQPDDRRRGDLDAVDQQRRHAFLHRGHLEEAIDDVGRVAARQRVGVAAEEGRHEGPGGANEDPALDILGHGRLHRPQAGCKRQKSEGHQREDDHRPEQHPEGDGVDEGFDRGRSNHRQQPDAEGESENRAHVPTLAGQEFAELPPRVGGRVRTVIRRLRHGDIHGGAESSSRPAAVSRPRREPRITSSFIGPLDSSSKPIDTP